MSTIKIGDKLTSDCGGTGLIGEMVVTKIVAADPDLDVFGAGDLVYVTETLNDAGTIHRYDTFFNASKLVGGVLTFNDWQWTLKADTTNTYKIADGIRQEIATAIVKQSEPGYDTRYMGQYYAVDTDGDNTLDAVMHRAENAPWNPWHDSATAFPVADLYADSGADFDPTAESFHDEDLDTGDLNEEEIEQYAWEAAVEFAMSELPKAFEPIE